MYKIGTELRNTLPHSKEKSFLNKNDDKVHSSRIVLLRKTNTNWEANYTYRRNRNDDRTSKVELDRSESAYEQHLKRNTVP